ncbi:MAG TPA: DNA polymerase domain-containing protein [Nitrosarchaeum sp.]|nr:DNA polymerase domain-containing protein [Nitrosarchaeum sp.]
MSTIFKSSYWFSNDVDGKCLVYIGGLTEDNKTVLVRVTDFLVHVYVELPSYAVCNGSYVTMKWTMDMIEKFVERFNFLGENAPEKYECLMMEMLNQKVKARTLKFYFKASRSIKSLEKCLNRNIFLGKYTFPSKSFKMHEQNIDPVLKFATIKKLDLGGWIKIAYDTNENISTADISFDCKEEWVERYLQKGNIYPMPKYCSFDIECFSKNPNTKLPNPEDLENKVFQISVIFGRLNFAQVEIEKTLLLSLFNPKKIKGVELIRCKTTSELFTRFVRIVRDYSPDIFIGYNIVKFDWNYILTQAALLGLTDNILSMSKLNDDVGVVRGSSWTSSAYGVQKFSYPELHGIVHVDVLVEIERNFKLPKYTLDYVAQHFLNETKKDVTPKQLFMFYRIAEILNEYEDKKLSLGSLRDMKDAVFEICSIKKSKGILLDFLIELKSANLTNIKRVMCKPMEITGEYCVHDSYLPILLVNKLNIWPNAVAMADTMCVPISYLSTRGQQIRVLAQLYREAHDANVVINYNAKDGKDKEKYQGAIVLKAVRGYYKNVAVLDFTSLYPSIIISFNICHTTYQGVFDPVQLEQLTKENKCYLLQWEEHVKCEHDLTMKKAATPKQKKSLICCKRYYKYLKPTFECKNSKFKINNQGLFPKLLLALLTERKKVKKELANAQAKLSMHNGTASEKDIAFFQSIGAKDILSIKKGSLSKKEVFDLEIKIKSLDAYQLALKVSANSAYGSYGAGKAYIPHNEGAAAVTAMGREFITDVVNYISRTGVDVIYGDTDSVMVTFDGASIQEVHKNAIALSKKVTHYLKCKILNISEDFEIKLKVDDKTDKMSIRQLNISHVDDVISAADKIILYNYIYLPVNLEFEHVFGKMLLLTKKKYLAEVVNEDGKFKTSVKKGVVVQRRDNCNFLRESYKLIAQKIFADKNYEQLISCVIKRVRNICIKKIPDDDLVIYVGVSDILKYAKQEEVEDDEGHKKTYFVDSVGDLFETTNPFDNRLTYKNIPQSILLQKLMNRGEQILPNSRLEYIYLDIPFTHQGDKAEDYAYYQDNKDKFRPDYILYLEKQFEKPIQDLIYTKYPRYHTYQKIDQTFERYVVDGYIEEIKFHTKEVQFPYKSSKKRICSNESWLSHIFFCDDVKKSINEFAKKTSREYTFRGVEASVTYALSQKHGKKLLCFLLQYKSRLVIDRFRKKYGLSKYLSDSFLVKIGSKIQVLTNNSQFKKGTSYAVKSIKKEGKGVNEIIYYETDDGFIRKCYVGIEKENLDVHKIVLYRKHYASVIKSLNQKIKKVNKV